MAQKVAQLQCCERGTLGTSTLHLFWDLFGMLAGRPVAIYLDAGAYPIVRWGVERAGARGVPVRTFSHHNADELQHRLKQDAGGRTRPWVVTDAFCPGCGKLAPLAAYMECAREYGGCLVLDDTQALGILGHSPGPRAPYGRGGGGAVPWAQIRGPDVIVVSSMAKAFGAPIAVLAGCQAAVEDFESNSQTRVHCSPPSIAAIRAAERALIVNREWGDSLRRRLARLVVHFRHRTARAGFSFRGGIFPVQTLVPYPDMDAVGLHKRLSELGTRTVLHDARNGSGARISFLITCRHAPREIEVAAGRLARSVSCATRPAGASATA